MSARTGESAALDQTQDVAVGVPHPGDSQVVDLRDDGRREDELGPHRFSRLACRIEVIDLDVHGYAQFSPVFIDVPY